MCVVQIKTFLLDVRYPQQGTVGNGYNHWKILDLVLDVSYIYFSNLNINSNPTNLPKY